jgi:hypothetical protein
LGFRVIIGTGLRFATIFIGGTGTRFVVTSGGAEYGPFYTDVPVDSPADFTCTVDEKMRVTASDGRTLFAGLPDLVPANAKKVKFECQTAQVSWACDVADVVITDLEVTGTDGIVSVGRTGADGLIVAGESRIPIAPEDDVRVSNDAVRVNGRQVVPVPGEDAAQVVQDL